MARKRGDAAAAIKAAEGMKTGRTSTGKRGSAPVRAARAATALDNPEVRQAFDVRRAELILDMEKIKLDGSARSQEQCVELVRQLQTLLSLKQVMVRPIVAELLKRSQRDLNVNGA